MEKANRIKWQHLLSPAQTADVGVGISGQEGMQAVMASDFAVTRFKFLERLVLVHGHWNYDRLARMILYFFYKNAAFVFVCFWYELYCGFSGAVMIDQVWSLTQSSSQNFTQSRMGVKSAFLTNAQ